jgi:hypothetical protein
MAQWEVTIRANILITDDDDDENQFAEQYTFIWSAPDFISAVMSVQQKLDTLNERTKKKWEETARKARFMEEYNIVGLIETDHVLFGDKWIDEFVERGVIDRNYAEDES